MCTTACSDPPIPPPSDDGPHFPAVESSIVVIFWFFIVYLFDDCLSVCLLIVCRFLIFFCWLSILMFVVGGLGFGVWGWLCTNWGGSGGQVMGHVRDSLLRSPDAASQRRRAPLPCRQIVSVLDIHQYQCWMFIVYHMLLIFLFVGCFLSLGVEGLRLRVFNVRSRGCGG